jgi:hypothetical protein
MAAISSSKVGASLVLLMMPVTMLKGFQTGADCSVRLLGSVGRSRLGGGTKMFDTACFCAFHIAASSRYLSRMRTSTASMASMYALVLVQNVRPTSQVQPSTVSYSLCTHTCNAEGPVPKEK